MKKIVGLSLAATLLAMLPQNAFAWKNMKFGVGLNFECASGNNSWRYWRNGPLEGGGHGAPYGGMGMGMGGMGYDGMGMGGGMPYSYAEPPVAPAAPAAAPAAAATPAYYNNPYPVQPTGYAGYQYYQPQSTPSYWYGY